MVKSIVFDQNRSKKCTKCKVYKSTNDFSFQHRPCAAHPEGKRKKTCKRCMSITNRAYNKKNRAKHRPRKRREYLQREFARGKKPKLRENERPPPTEGQTKAILQRHLIAARRQVEHARKLAERAKEALSYLEGQLNKISS